MARAVRARIGGERTWTVVADDLAPLVPAERFLAHLRALSSSPNTIRSYATGLAQWWTVLDCLGQRWDGIDEATVNAFIRYLRTGDPPGTTRIGEAPTWLSPASINVRMGAVQGLYRYAQTLGVTKPYTILYGGHSRRSSYRPFLEGIAVPRGVERRTFRIPATARRRQPILEPAQIRTILDACATQNTDGTWGGGLAGLRDRLLFSMLAETGMRVGEALSLRHEDMCIGQGSQPLVRVVPRQDHPHGSRVKRRQTSDIIISDGLEAVYSQYVWELFEAGVETRVPDLGRWFVFVNVAAEPRFQPMRVESVYRRVRRINADHPELPQSWTPHWLRHTHATALLLMKTPYTVVQRRLGHADIQTTMNTYGWVDSEAELKALSNWRSYTAGEDDST